MQSRFEQIRDLIEAISWLVAIVGGGIAAWLGIRQMRLGLKQREEELHWRRAETARRLLDELNEHQGALDAMAILETVPGRLRSPNGQRFGVYTDADIACALQVPATSSADRTLLDERLVYLRDCFDYFFYYMNRVAHAVETGLVLFEDVQPITYYANALGGKKPLFKSYLEYCGWTSLLNFLNRFSGWRDAQSESHSTIANHPNSCTQCP